MNPNSRTDKHSQTFPQPYTTKSYLTYLSLPILHHLLSYLSHTTALINPRSLTNLAVAIIHGGQMVNTRRIDLPHKILHPPHHRNILSKSLMSSLEHPNPRSILPKTHTHTVHVHQCDAMHENTHLTWPRLCATCPNFSMTVTLSIKRDLISFHAPSPRHSVTADTILSRYPFVCSDAHCHASSRGVH